MKFSFPWVAAGIGLILAMVLIRVDPFSAGGTSTLPPLTLLFISEFGFLVTGAGGAFAGKAFFRQARNWTNLLLSVACFALSLAFLAVGVLLWRGAAG